MELAKTLLAKLTPSVTEIGLAVGFSETSSFTAAFRKATGLTPTGYVAGERPRKSSSNLALRQSRILDALAQRSNHRAIRSSR